MQINTYQGPVFIFFCLSRFFVSLAPPPPTPTRPPTHTHNLLPTPLITKPTKKKWKKTTTESKKKPRGLDGPEKHITMTTYFFLDGIKTFLMATKNNYRMLDLGHKTILVPLLNRSLLHGTVDWRNNGDNQLVPVKLGGTSVNSLSGLPTLCI